MACAGLIWLLSQQFVLIPGPRGMTGRVGGDVRSAPCRGVTVTLPRELPSCSSGFPSPLQPWALAAHPWRAVPSSSSLWGWKAPQPPRSGLVLTMPSFHAGLVMLYRWEVTFFSPVAYIRFSVYIYFAVLQYSMGKWPS